MNTLRKTLFFSLTLQVCLAAAIFAAAEEAPLALFTIPIAIGSLVVIDLLVRLKIPSLLLNLAGIAALVLAFVEFRHEGESRLLAGGHLVAYLLWTFLLQVKDMRRMWWMFALSVLLVATAAVLTMQPWFGAALFVYTVSTVWTMSLLSLTRAALLSDPHLLSHGALSPGEQGPAVEEILATPHRGQSVARNGVRTDEQGRWISPRFLGGGAITFALTLFVGMTFFVLTPRVWIGGLPSFGNDPFKGSGGRTGFTDRVKLGDIGSIMESDEIVMQVSVRHGETSTSGTPGRPLSRPALPAAIGSEPLFRGAVLEIYQEGQWSQRKYNVGWQDAFEAPGPLKLEVTLQPIDSPVLFYTGIPIAGEAITETGQLKFHQFTSALRTDEADLRRPYSYRMTMHPPGVELDPDRRRWRKNFFHQNGFTGWMGGLLDTPSSRLSILAKQVLDRSLPHWEPDGEATARTLEAYLRDSREFDYTMDLSIDDPTIDPVEDFVFNRKKGHCEYFASALALMLRGVGIPCRLISGFKGAEYNEWTGDLEVRALHAHAWVEAFVDGGWVTLDPTPGQRDLEIADKAKVAGPSLVKQTQSIWFQGMSYSKSQQDEWVYAPLREVGTKIRMSFAGLMEGDFPLLRDLVTRASSPGEWFSGAGGVAALVLLLTISGGVWLVRKLFKRWKGWTRERDLAHRRAITVEFYARLVRILQRFGLAEIPSLTPREFAHTAEERFHSRFHQAGLTGTALRLVEMFYAVRFGDLPLSTAQLESVDQQLAQLEHCLIQPVG